MWPCRLNLHQGSLLLPDPTLLSIIYLPWKYGAQYGREQTVCCTSSVCVCVTWSLEPPHTHAALTGCEHQGHRSARLCVCVLILTALQSNCELSLWMIQTDRKWRTELWLNFEGQFCDFSMKSHKAELTVCAWQGLKTVLHSEFNSTDLPPHPELVPVDTGWVTSAFDPVPPMCPALSSHSQTKLASTTLIRLYMRCSCSCDSKANVWCLY